MAETSDRMSALASRYARITPEYIEALTQQGRVRLAADIRSIAASLLRQDETRGLRGLIGRLFK